MSYPLPRFQFQVELDNEPIGFAEVSGLGAEIAVIEYREGSDAEQTPRKFPGMTKYPDVKLSRGIAAGDNRLFEWFDKVKVGSIERRSVAISLLNEDREPAVVWKLRDAFPRKLLAADLDATANEVAIEELVLAHEGLTIEHA